MEYVKISDVAAEWGISPRRLQAMCASGKIEGASRFGRAWMIPKGLKKPLDARTKAYKNSHDSSVDADVPLPRKTPFLHMTNLYDTPGGAEQCAERLYNNHEAYTLFTAELAYSRGEIDRVYESANYLLKKHSGFYAIIAGGMLLSLCAIWRGDLNMWRKAKIHIAEAPAKSDQDRDIIAFSLTAVDSMLYDVSSFPDWFKIGCFDPLHKDSFPSARVFYAKYLYTRGYAVATKELSLPGISGLALMSLIPATLEPMISQSAADGSIISEIYLRLTCAAVYLSVGNSSQAVRHIDRAIALSIPDRLYGILAEYSRVLGNLLEDRISSADPDTWSKVKVLYSVYNAGWTKLSGSVRGKNLATTLTRKERAVAKLAAFGMQNSEIASQLNMSVSGVKQAVRIVSEKTGVSRDEFAAIL